MHTDLINYIESPFSGLDFKLDVYQEGVIGDSATQIISGKLYCGEEEYPIINGVPRILPPDLASKLTEKYPDFFNKYANKFASQAYRNAPITHKLESKTMDSFGHQWNEFADMYAQWKNHFLDFLGHHIKSEDFQNKCVLDMGCGFGRHSFYSAEFGAKKVIGIDISYSVDAAILVNGIHHNVDFIQADIFSLPVKREFELAYSIGVLQHTRDAKLAFKILGSKVKKGGAAFAWIYGIRPLSYRLTVDLLRRATVGLNANLLQLISFVLAITSYISLLIPVKILRSIGLRRLSDLIPYHRYADYPFRVGYADWYDRLSAPRTNYFNENEVKEMLTYSGLKNTDYSYRSGGSWRIIGSA